MLVEVSRGSISCRDATSRRGFPLPAAVNDLIGLRDETVYYSHLVDTYGLSLFQQRLVESADDTPTMGFEESTLELARLAFTVKRLINKWADDGIPELFLRAAKLAETGHFSAELAELNEDIHRNPGDEPDNVNDLLELATWSLDQTLRHQPILVRNCSFCGIPWITSDDEHSYCARPAPGRLMSCRFIKKDERFRTSNREWRREYLKVYDRKRRGTISETEWDLWKSMNGPELWEPFDDWKAFGDQILAAFRGTPETENPEPS